MEQGKDVIRQNTLVANWATEVANANAAFALNSFAVASVPLNNDFTDAITQPEATVNVLAELTVAFPMSVAGLTLRVFVSPKGVAPDTSDGSPELAGSIGFFGMRAMDHTMHGKGGNDPAIFDVDVTNAISRLTELGVMQPGAEIDVAVVPVRSDGGVSRARSLGGILQSVRLKTI